MGYRRDDTKRHDAHLRLHVTDNELQTAGNPGTCVQKKAKKKKAEQVEAEEGCLT